MADARVPRNGTHAPLIMREADLATPAYVCPVPTHRYCTCVRPVYAPHTGLQTVPCPAQGCGATFLTVTEMAAHYLAQHERSIPTALSGSDRGVQPAEGEDDISND